MTPFQKIAIRNRIIAIFPFLPRIAAMKRACAALGIWEREGWTAPPPYFVRIAMLETEARAVGAETFIETGTFRGDTIWMFRKRFRKIVTIEVQDDLAALARQRFRKHPHVSVIHGDSASVLADVCKDIDGPCLVYLDGHYSAGFTGSGEKECPITEELQALFSHLKHPFRILIDDARLFGSDPSYPSRDNIEDFIRRQPGGWHVRIENDAFVIWMEEPAASN